MNIGFDLDGIFIDKPPLIPKEVIERLYGKKRGILAYRIPSHFEQLIRKVSHNRLLRPPIKKNIKFIKKQSKLNHHKYYLISGRFGFIQKETELILKAYGIHAVFKDKFINLSNTQPHLFKHKMLKKLNIHKFVDDDFELLKFLAKKNRKIKFFWINKKGDKQITKNLFAIDNLSKIIKR